MQGIQEVWKKDQRRRIESLEEEFAGACRSIGLSHDAAVLVEKNRVYFPFTRDTMLSPFLDQCWVYCKCRKKNMQCKNVFLACKNLVMCIHFFARCLGWFSRGFRVVKDSA